MNTTQVLRFLDNPNYILNMSEWEKTFIESIKKSRKYNPLTGKQQIKLWDIYLKYGKGK